MSPKRNKRARIRPGLKQRRFRQRLISYREAKGRPAFRRIPRAAVPSFFTLMNLFCGFLSLIQVYDGNLENAAWLIILAGFFDGLDGMMARLTNGTSLFGVELDSLSDVVSFGVAPSFLIWAAGLSEMGTTGVIIASLPALAGAIRLARFNISFEGTKGDYFSGLPIPVSAAVIVAIILNEDLLQDLFLGKRRSTHRHDDSNSACRLDGIDYPFRFFSAAVSCLYPKKNPSKPFSEWHRLGFSWFSGSPAYLCSLLYISDLG